MRNLCYHRHRFPVEIIQHAAWLYFRFPPSFRDVEDLLAERVIDVSYETVCRWSIKFGSDYARRLRRSHPPCPCPLKLGHYDAANERSMRWPGSVILTKTERHDRLKKYKRRHRKYIYAIALFAIIGLLFATGVIWAEVPK